MIGLEEPNKQQIKCCPLRLNESSAITIKTLMEHKSRHNLEHQQVNSKMVNKGLCSGNKTILNNNNNIVNSTTAVRLENLLKRRRTSTTTSKIGLNLIRRCNFISSLVIIFLCFTLHPTCTKETLAANSITYANAPSYPSPLASISIPNAPQSGPSLCPLVSSCLCKWSNGKQGASCDHRNLQTIPSQLPQDTQVLDMNGNNLIRLERHIFQDRLLTNLQRIHLVDCKISYISDEAFAHLTNLVELDLSHNNLQHVPIKSFGPLNHSLRKLSLAYNPIQIIEQDSFSSLTHLTILDLSNCRLSQLNQAAFSGLHQLKDLKLHNNSLTQLPANVIADLPEYLNNLELDNNPWHCDCELRSSIDWLNRHHVQQSMQPTCATPQRHKDIRWNQVKSDEFICPPVVINKQQDRIVGAGSNISLECTARGSQPMTFVWFQDEKNLTTVRSNTTEPPSSTKLLEEKRYEIAEESGPISQHLNTTTSILYLYDLKLTDTSLFLCWVENAAGYTIANFSLIVNDSPPANLNGQIANDGSNVGFGSALLRSIGITGNGNENGSDTQLGIISLIFVIVLIAGIVLLLVLKQQTGIVDNRSSKSSQLNDLKKSKASVGSHHNHKSYSSSNHDSMLNHASDVEDDDDCSGSDADSSQSSSCAEKKQVVMSTGALDGFIEHMRSGIINMDYHSMSPVIQFNKSKQQQQQQQQQKAPYLDTMQAMHHFPSASNASSVPPYHQYGQHLNGSASMTTTTSDLSPSSGSSAATTSAPNQYLQPHHAGGAVMMNNPTINCDHLVQEHLHLQQQQQQQQHEVPAASVSFTSDYQSNYGEPDMQATSIHQQMSVGNTMMPPMYYDNSTSSMAPPDLYHVTNGMYNPMNLHGTLRPSSMSLAGQQQQQPVFQMQDVHLQQSTGNLHQLHYQQQQQQQQHRLSQHRNNQLQRSLDSDRFQIL